MVSAYRFLCCIKGARDEHMHNPLEGHKWVAISCIFEICSSLASDCLNIRPFEAKSIYWLAYRVKNVFLQGFGTQIDLKIMSSCSVASVYTAWEMIPENHVFRNHVFRSIFPSDIVCSERKQQLEGRSKKFSRISEVSRSIQPRARGAVCTPLCLRRLNLMVNFLFCFLNFTVCIPFNSWNV